VRILKTRIMEVGQRLDYTDHVPPVNTSKEKGQKLATGESKGKRRHTVKE